MENSKIPLYLGGILLAIGLLANRGVSEFLLFPDGHFDHPVIVWAMAIFRITCICAGLYIILRRSSFHYAETLLVLFSIIFALCLMEVGTRVWLSHIATDSQARYYTLSLDLNEDSLQWSPHHYFNYYPTPNYRRGLTSHNSLGYRGGEFPVDKPQGTVRIVALGGSTTYTIRVDNNKKTFTSHLENIIREKFGHENVEVINAGVGGYNSWESLINLEFRVLDLNPDLIIIYLGTNDVHTRLVTVDSYSGDNSGRRRQWEPQRVPLLVEHSYLLRVLSAKLNLGVFRREGLGTLVNAATFRGAQSQQPAAEPMLLLDKNPPTYFKRNLANMVAIARAHGVEVMLATWAHSPYIGDYASSEHYQRGFREGNSVVVDLAREREVMLFEFDKRMPQERKYWADGRHVNAEGARVKAELFAEFIEASGFLSRTCRDEGANC